MAPSRARRIPRPAEGAAARAQPRLPHVVMAGGLDGEVGCSRNLGAAAGTVEAGTPGGKRKCNGKPRSFSRSFGGGSGGHGVLGKSVAKKPEAASENGESGQQQPGSSAAAATRSQRDAPSGKGETVGSRVFP